MRFVRGLFSMGLSVLVALLGVTVMAPAANAAPRGDATTAEYNKIKTGQKLSKVRSLIGSRGEQVSSTEARGSYAFVWRSTDGKDVYVRFRADKVVKKKRIADKTVSDAEFRAIKKGQSYSTVKGIARESGKVYWSYAGETFYSWCSADSRYFVTAYFNRGKLVEREYLHWTEAPEYWPNTCRAAI